MPRQTKSDLERVISDMLAVRCAVEAAAAAFAQPPCTAFGDRLRAALAAYERALWQPIETAPMDGSEVLVWDGSERVHIGWWWNGGGNQYAEGWLAADEEDGRITPTQWRPLPAGPGDVA